MGISNSEIVALRGVTSNVKGFGKPSNLTLHLEKCGWLTIQSDGRGCWTASLTPKGRQASLTQLSDEHETWSSQLHYRVLHNGDVLWIDGPVHEVQRFKQS